MPSPQEFIALAQEVCELLVHSFGRGTLTTDGVQYGSSGVATSTDTWKVVDTQTIQPFGAPEGSLARGGAIMEVEFALTAAVAFPGTTTGSGGAVTYAWQARNYNSGTATDDWVWLTPTSSGHSTTVGSTSQDTSTYSGYLNIQTNLNKVPLQIRLLVISGGAGTSTSGASSTGASARTKSSSYVRVAYRVE